MDGNDWRGWVIDRRRRVRIDILRMPFGTYLSLPSISFVVGRGPLLNIRSINVEDKRISMIDCVVVVHEVKLKSSESPPPHPPSLLNDSAKKWKYDRRLPRMWRRRLRDYDSSRIYSRISFGIVREWIISMLFSISKNSMDEESAALRNNLCFVGKWHWSFVLVYPKYLIF